MKLLRATVFIVITALLAVCAATAAPADQGRLKVLFLVGGCCHDMKNLPAELTTVLEGTGQFKIVKITEDRNELIPANINKYDAVLLYTQGSDLTAEQEKGITEFVANGKGYAGIHCASDSFKNSDAYWKMLGGRFTGHGSGTFKVKITGKRNPIVSGMSDFEITDETYNHAFHKDAKIMVLARRESDGEPVVWIQNYGKGRVFYTGLGHGKEAWDNKSFQELMVRGLRWACGLKPTETKTVSTGACCGLNGKCK